MTVPLLLTSKHKAGLRYCRLAALATLHHSSARCRRCSSQKPRRRGLRGLPTAPGERASRNHRPADGPNKGRLEGEAKYFISIRKQAGGKWRLWFHGHAALYSQLQGQLVFSAFPELRIFDTC